MLMEFINMRKSKYMYAFIIVNTLMLLLGCNNVAKEKGFTLQHFTIVNPLLNSIEKGISDSMYMKNISNPDEVIGILVLRIFDSVPEFCFTIAKKEDVLNYCMYSTIRRIVGYVQNDKTMLIVLSEEHNTYKFESTFYEFLIPTSEKKYFEYIYFPDDQYAVNEKGIPNPPVLFDPYYYCYAYRDGEMIYMNYYDTSDE